jgi:cytochrome c-type biogenesis protein CcmH/NrfG
MEAFMADSNTPANSVKKETMLLVATICLLVGFVGGIIFTVFKTGTGSGPETATSEQQRMTADQGRRMLALEQEVAARPNNVEAWIELGNLYFGMNEYEKSIRSYRRALDLDPTNAHVWTDMGVMYRSSGQSQQALEIFAKAKELDPNLSQPRFNTGVVLFFDLNQHEAGLEAWEDLLKTHPAATAPNGQPLREFIDFHRGSLQQQAQR